MPALGTRLVHAGLLTARECQSAGECNGQVFVARVVPTPLSESALLGFLLSEGYGPIADSSVLIDPAADALSLLEASAWDEFAALPVGVAGETLSVALADPSDYETLAELGRRAQRSIRPLLARRSDLVFALDRAKAFVSSQLVDSAEAVPLLKMKPWKGNG